jgi:hypothetical protein
VKLKKKKKLNMDKLNWHILKFMGMIAKVMKDQG